MEEKDTDLNRDECVAKADDSNQVCKERPSTTGGRIFGTVSEGLHSSYKPKSSRIDLPSGCICREEIKRIEKEFVKMK